jgi:nucleotide-binding universal stress UspA family protein
MEDRPPVLVPIRILEGESIPEGVPGLLANAHVVLLGYHEIPEQTAAGQAREQYEDQATRRLEEFEARLEERGATVESHLVFTHESQQTIDRMIYEHGCLAVLIPNATTGPESVLVAVRGTVGVDRLVRVISGLFAAAGVDITLYHVAEGGESDEDAQTLLDGIVTRLVDNGVAPESIETHTDRDADLPDAVIQAAAEHDAVVMGETDPSLVTFIFGMPTQQVADRFLRPVLVVQRERPREDAPETSPSE